MLKSVRKRLRRYKGLKRIYDSIMWNKHILSDTWNTYVSKSKIEVVTPLGFRMISRKYIANLLMLKGTFESEEMDIIRSHLQTADLFVDVGANIGYYACLARSLSKSVVAVEPQSQNLECLYANLYNNGWSDTEIFPIGLSSSPGLLTLYGASGPSASLVKGWAGYSERFKTVIPVNTMDNILQDRFEGKKLFIKIDVEGAEYNILQGAMKTLAMSPQPTWFIEICLREFHPGGVNPNYSAIFDLFWKHGYEVILANRENRRVTPDDIHNWLSDKASKKNDEFNYLFVPKN